MSTLAEGINIFISKGKLHEDNHLVNKLTLLKKIPPAKKNLAYVQIRMG